MKKVPLLLVDDADREITYFKNACTHPKMKQHFDADIEFQAITILHEATMDSQLLCQTIHDCLQANQGWIVAMDRNLAGGFVGEAVIKHYRQVYPQDRVVFFAYTTDVGTPEYEARWWDGETSLIQGFLPKSLLFNLGFPEKNAWVENLQQAIRSSVGNSYQQVLDQLPMSTHHEQGVPQRLEKASICSTTSAASSSSFNNVPTTVNSPGAIPRAKNAIFVTQCFLHCCFPSRRMQTAVENVNETVYRASIQ